VARRDFRRACVPAFVGGVALTTALGVGAVATTPSPAHVASDVGLKALITHGSATNWNADGIDKFYGLDWNAKYGPTTVSQFSLFPYNVNPDNLKAALRNNVGDADPDLVLTSGRGSGAATVTMLQLLNSGKPQDRQLVLDTRWILDNNVNRPNGGYGSRYIPFTILGVYPWPTPTDEGVDIVDVGYEYAWNSSAPAYVTNVVALLNSIIAYAYRYKSQAFTGLPVDPDHPDAIDPVTGEPVLEKGYHYIVEVDGTVTKVPLDSRGNTNTAYVTYRADGLPMLQPLRDFGGHPGNALADLLQPALKVIVDASYPGGDPVASPDRYITASLLTPPDVAIKALNKLPAAIQEGFAKFKRDVGLTKKQTPAPTMPEPKAVEVNENPPTPEPADTDGAALAPPRPEEQSKVSEERKSLPVNRNRLTDADESADTKDKRVRPRPLRQLAERVTKALTPKAPRHTTSSPAGTAPSQSESTGAPAGGDSTSRDAD
jgi:hypothetical protein